MEINQFLSILERMQIGDGTVWDEYTQFKTENFLQYLSLLLQVLHDLPDSSEKAHIKDLCFTVARRDFAELKPPEGIDNPYHFFQSQFPDLIPGFLTACSTYLPKYPNNAGALLAQIIVFALVNSNDCQLIEELCSQMNQNEDWAFQQGAYTALKQICEDIELTPEQLSRVIDELFKVLVIFPQEQRQVPPVVISLALGCIKTEIPYLEPVLTSDEHRNGLFTALSNALASSETSPTAYDCLGRLVRYFYQEIGPLLEPVIGKALSDLTPSSNPKILTAICSFFRKIAKAEISEKRKTQSAQISELSKNLHIESSSTSKKDDGGVSLGIVEATVQQLFEPFLELASAVEEDEELSEESETEYGPAEAAGSALQFYELAAPSTVVPLALQALAGLESYSVGKKVAVAKLAAGIVFTRTLDQEGIENMVALSVRYMAAPAVREKEVGVYLARTIFDLDCDVAVGVSYLQYIHPLLSEHPIVAALACDFIVALLKAADKAEAALGETWKAFPFEDFLAVLIERLQSDIQIPYLASAVFACLSQLILRAPADVLEKTAPVLTQLLEGCMEMPLKLVQPDIFLFAADFFRAGKEMFTAACPTLVELFTRDDIDSSALVALASLGQAVGEAFLPFLPQTLEELLGLLAKPQASTVAIHLAKAALSLSRNFDPFSPQYGRYGAPLADALASLLGIHGSDFYTCDFILAPLAFFLAKGPEAADSIAASIVPTVSAVEGPILAVGRADSRDEWDDAYDFCGTAVNYFCELFNDFDECLSQQWVNPAFKLIEVIANLLERSNGVTVDGRKDLIHRSLILYGILFPLSPEKFIEFSNECENLVLMLEEENANYQNESAIANKLLSMIHQESNEQDFEN